MSTCPITRGDRTYENTGHMKSGHQDIRTSDFCSVAQKIFFLFFIEKK